MKFCCPRELQADYLKALDLLNSHQRAAAVERCDRALAKVPTQSCFLVVKIMALMQMDELEEARRTWEQLRQAAEKNPVSDAFRVLFALREEDVQQVVLYLQDTLEHAQEERLPGLVVLAIEQTTVALLQGTQWFAFMQHAHHFDNRLSHTHPESGLLKLLRSACLDVQYPLVCKQPWFDRLLAQYPEPFRKADVHRDLVMFRLRRLRDRAATWHAQGQFEPGATAYLALMNALLLDNATAGKLFRQFAQRSDVPADLAAEAIILAHMLDPAADPGILKKVSLEYVVQDSDALMERLLSDRHFRKVDTEIKPDPDSDEPPPRAIFEFFDRPYPAERPPINEYPQALGGAFFYGRQTDREPRLVFEITDNAEGKNRNHVTRLLSDLLGNDPTHEQLVTFSPLLELGPHISSADMADSSMPQEFSEQYINYTVLEYWPNQPHPLLGGKTPTEAIGDPGLKTRLLAALLHLEVTPPFDVWNGDYREYWQRFSVEHDIESWSPRSADIMGLTRINTGQLDDATIWPAAVYAAAMGVRRACNELGRALLGRPSLCDRDELGELLQMLIQSTAPIAVRLEIVNGAVEWCERKKVSAGTFLVAKFICHVMLQQSKESSETLRLLTSRYTNEPETMQLLFHTLQQMGLVGPDGLPIEHAREAQQPQEAAAASGLWTPDQPAAAQAAKPGKLWLPGMD